MPIAGVVLLALLSGCAPKQNPIFWDIWHDHVTRAWPKMVVSGSSPGDGREKRNDERTENLKDASDALYRYYIDRLESVKRHKDLFYDILISDGFKCALYYKYMICKTIFPNWGIALVGSPEKTVDHAQATEFVLELTLADDKFVDLEASVFHLGIRDGRRSP